MQTIAIAHSKGGVGKSLLTLNLAPLFENVLIIDLDTQNSSTNINAARKERHMVKTATNKDQFFSLLDQYENTHDILIDCGGVDSDMNRLAISNSDIVITPLKDNSFEILAFIRFLEVIKNIQRVSEVKAYALINNAHSQTKDFSRLEYMTRENDSITLLKTIIRSRADLSNLLEYGTTAVESKPTSKAAQEITNLYQEIRSLQ